MADAGSVESLSAAAPGASGRLTKLAAARVAAQAMGFVWFIFAARSLSPGDLGLLSGGLALVVVLGGLCDLGTTRTIVRHVAARPSGLHANLRRALVLRVGAGVVVGGLATVVLPLVTDLRAAVVGLAAWIAAASGASEVNFAALRSIGAAGSEVRILLLERVTFTALAVAALATDRGPLTILALYGATNTCSGLLGAIVCLRTGERTTSVGAFFDREGRRTALSSSLLIVAPRASIVVLVFLGTTPAVGAFAVAQKPTEALSLLVIALAAPALPILRARVVAGHGAGAALTAGRVAAAGLAVASGILGWLVADPHGALALLLGSDSDLRAAGALRALALAAIVAVVRGAMELLVLAHERASDLVWAMSGALIVTVSVGAVVIGEHGAAGAGWAALAGEAVAAVVIIRAALRLGSARDLFGPLQASVVLTGVTAALVHVVDGPPRVGLALAVAASLVGLVLARRQVLALEDAVI